jgi:phosphatidylglycerophosphate synthase
MSTLEPREAPTDTRSSPRAGVALTMLSRKERPRRELTVELVFGPLARLVVRALLPLRVPAPAVVLANTAAGLAGAWTIWHGDLIAGALLLQLKTLLDNADGQLARAAGRTSTLGRYLDTEADLVVNVAVFAALGHVTGQPWLALVALAGLTAVLSVDFNLEALYREARGEQFRPAPDRETGGTATRALTAGYEVVFAPQDRAVRWLAHRRLERILSTVSDPERRERATLAYHDGATVGVLINLGLSTQLAALGAFLAAGAPAGYLWSVLGCIALVGLLWLRRERRARAVAAS